MVNPTEYGFSSKTLWVRPMVPMGVPGGGKPQTSEPKPPADPMADPAALKRAVDRLEQQVKDALLARTTAHMGEQRILKNAFIKFDKDASGSVDYPELYPDRSNAPTIHTICPALTCSRRAALLRAVPGRSSTLGCIKRMRD